MILLINPTKACYIAVATGGNDTNTGASPGALEAYRER